MRDKDDGQALNVLAGTLLFNNRQMILPRVAALGCLARISATPPT